MAKEINSITVEFRDGDNVLLSTVASKKDFSTGSKGFFFNGKFTDPNNPDHRYTVSAPIILIGSKPKK